MYDTVNITFPAAYIAGILASISPSDIIGWYLTALSLLCGTITLVQIAIKLFDAIKAHKAGNTTESVERLDDIKEELEDLKDDFDKND